MLSLIKGEFEKMIQDPVSTQELEDAKSYLRGSLPLSLTSTDKIADLLLSIKIDDLPIDYLDTRDAALASASASDIHGVAARLLSPEKFATVLVGAPELEGELQEVQIVRDLPNVE